MAGVKRKLEATKGSAAVPSAGPTAAAPSTPNTATGDTSHIRVTRSHRASQDARANHNDSTKSNNASTPANNKSGAPRLSRIVTLSTRAARANSAAIAANNAVSIAANSPASTARETRASRTRAAAPAAPAPPIASTQVDSVASTKVPETPRTKRVKRGPTVEETPRTTRQSARLRPNTNANENAFPEADVASRRPEEVSPSMTFTSGRTRKRSRQTFEITKDTIHDGVTVSSADKTLSPEVTTSEKAPISNLEDAKASQELSEESSHLVGESLEAGNSQEDKDESNTSTNPKANNTSLPTETPSPSLSRKRKSLDTKANGAADTTSFSGSLSKKLKLEDGEPEVEQQLQSGSGGKTESHSPTDGAAESKADDESRQITEEIEGSTPETATEPATGKTFRGGRVRGRGRGGRSRAAARFATGKRGRGGTRSARGGRTGRQLDRSSDVEPDRSPSPSAATQKLRDRQRELEKAFRKVAAAQRLALAVLASQSQKKLARDKNAHKNVPEYDEIKLLLDAKLRERQEVYRREYQLRVDQENRVFAANKEAIEERFKASARYIQEEHLFASQGEYMAFVEGRRAAEDDEHTETDGSETENERGPVVRPTKQVVRGFNSSFVRQTAGAAAYDRGQYGWDDFVQRAKVGDDIDPQMKEMRADAGPFAGLSAEAIIDLLVQATGIVEVRRNGVVEEVNHPPVLSEVRPTALSALADAAAAELPRPSTSQATPRLSSHRALLPQPSQPQMAHGPTDPRSFVLPPPTPQRQGPRRLLPAAQQIPPITEQLGLPDPFAMGGPPQLPPPPGSNFQRPPLPGFLTGHRPQHMYYPPHPHPPPGPPPPGSRPY